MLKFSKTELFKNLVLIAILILVILVFDFPMYNKITEIYQTLFTEKETYSKQYQLGNSYEKSLEDFRKYDGLIPSFAEVFPKTGQELVLITKLEQLAAKYNLHQKIDLSSNGSQFTDEINILGLDVTLIGEYNNFVRYIAELEENKFQIGVQGINIKKANQNNLEINLVTDTYWLK